MALWKPTKIPITTNIDIYTTLSNIWDGAFGKNIYAFEVINYFRKMFFVLVLERVLDSVLGEKWKCNKKLFNNRKIESILKIYIFPIEISI